MTLYIIIGVTVVFVIAFAWMLVYNSSDNRFCEVCGEDCEDKYCGVCSWYEEGGE